METEKGHILPMLKYNSRLVTFSVHCTLTWAPELSMVLRHDGFMSWWFFLSIVLQQRCKNRTPNIWIVRQMIQCKKSCHKTRSLLFPCIVLRHFACLHDRTGSIFYIFPSIFVFYTHILKPVVVVMIHIISISIHHHTITHLFKPREPFT